MAALPTDTAPSRPYSATPPSPQDTRPSFSRSRSQQTLVDPSRSFSSVRAPARPLLSLNIDHALDMRRSPVSTPTSGTLSTPSSAHGSTTGLTTSAFATMQKVYHAKDDIGFWSSLYSQHFIHTRQDATSPQIPTSLVGGGSGSRTTSSRGSTSNDSNSNIDCTDSQGVIKVWQVLTKTDSLHGKIQGYDRGFQPSSWHQQQPQQQKPTPQFERLPIKVQTAARGLSTSGQPFSIVFFFTVEAAPATLWYVESAFTRSSTTHEHLELMGTFQPNDPTDPTSFYIYETHEFTTVQPSQEDTTLDILVQSPTGAIYAEFSYTFVNESKHGSTSSVSSIVSLQSGAQSNYNNGGATVTQRESIEHVPPPLSPRPRKPHPETAHTPLDSYDLVDVGTSDTSEYFANTSASAQQYSPHQQTSQYTQQVKQAVTMQDGSVNSPSNSTKDDATLSRSTTQTSIPTVVQSPFEDEYGEDEEDMEELTAESYTEEPDAGEHFMQATSEFFSKMGYWLYNSRVGQYIARDDKVRTRTVFPTDDIWVLGVHYEFDTSEPTVSPPEITRTRKTSALQAHVGLSRPAGSKTSSVNGVGSGLEVARATDRRKSQISSPRSLTDSETFPSSQKSEQGRSRSKDRHLEKQREKELAKARKIAKAHEREVEKEQERERALEKARLKEHEKLEKLKLRISHPHFQKEGKVHESKDNGHFHPEPERKSHSIHGYQFDAHPPTIDFGGNAPESSEQKQSVIRRMRSISILQKVPSTLDLRLTKKSSQEPATRILPERTHQSRSQSISSFSVFSHRSGASSSVSSHSQEAPKTRPTSPPVPSSLKTSISAHEALSSASNPSEPSKAGQLNFSQKQLPNLPSVDGSPDIPLYNQQESSHPGMNAVTEASVAGERPSKRRMTISEIFSKESKPEPSSSLASLKTLITPSKGQSKTKETGLVQALSQKVSFGSHLSKDASKKGVTKNVQHWLERRLSSNNLHQQVFIASTDEPVPQVSKDILNSQPSSPLSPNPHRTFDIQGFEQEAHLSGQKQAKSKKRSSMLPTSSASSPKSVLKASSPLSSTSPSFSESRGRPSSPLGISGLDDIGETETIPSFPRFGGPDLHTDEMVNWSSLLGPSLGSSFDLKHELASSTPTPRTLADTLPKTDISATRPSASRELSSFADLVILPPLPPESPTEAFVLLDQEKNGSSSSLEQKDSFETQNRRLKDQLAAFSSSKEESFSDLRSDWEALWPSKSAVQAIGVKNERPNEFVHVKEKVIMKAGDHDEEEKQRRERIRKIGSAYLKVRTPTSDLTGGYLNVVDSNHAAPRQSPEIVSPRPQLSIAQQKGGLGEALAVIRTSSPVQSLDLLGEGLTASPPSSRAPTLSLQVKIDRESQSSPISPSLSMDRSWKVISPKSVSPRHSLPPLPSSTSTSSRSASGMNSSLDIIGAEETVLDRGMSQDSSMTRPKSDELLSIPILSPTHAALSSLEKQPDSPKRPSPNQTTLQKFMSDYQSRVWFTYRKDMARIEPSFYTSDAGWGCMMRTGQSLLAQAFVQLMLGREWRSNLKQTELNHQKYKTLLSWFADEPERYYSIHNIAKSGLALDKRIGEWFGPSTVAHALRRLSQKHVNCPVTIMVPMDNCLRMSDIVNAAAAAHSGNGTPPAEWGTFESTPESGTNGHSGSSSHSQRTKWKPVVLLMPVRYGLEKLTERYIGNLKELFKLPQFLGIAGGRPGRSLYFVACQGSELFYFDPHFVKPRATQEELNQCPASSYHCHSVRTMEIVELDPSMMLGFLISSFMDLVDLSNRLKRDMEKAYPLLTLMVDVSIPASDPAPAQVQASMLDPSPLPILTPISPMVVPLSIPTMVQTPVQMQYLAQRQAATNRESATSPAPAAVQVFEATPISAARSRARTPAPSPTPAAVPVFDTPASMIVASVHARTSASSPAPTAVPTAPVTIPTARARTPVLTPAVISAARVHTPVTVSSPIAAAEPLFESATPMGIPPTEAFTNGNSSTIQPRVPTFEIMAPTPMASPVPAAPVSVSIDEAVASIAASIVIPTPWAMETQGPTTATTLLVQDLVGPPLDLVSASTELRTNGSVEKPISTSVTPVTPVEAPTRVPNPVEELTVAPLKELVLDVEEPAFVPAEDMPLTPVEEPVFVPIEDLSFVPVEELAFAPVEVPMSILAQETALIPTVSEEMEHAVPTEESRSLPVEAPVSVPSEVPTISAVDEQTMGEEEPTSELAHDSVPSSVLVPIISSVVEEAVLCTEQEQESEQEGHQLQREEERAHGDGPQFEPGSWIGGIVPGDTTVMVVEARASIKVRHVQAIVDGDDSEYDEVEEEGEGGGDGPIEESFSYSVPVVPATLAEEVVSISSRTSVDESIHDSPHFAPQDEPMLLVQLQSQPLLHENQDSLLQKQEHERLDLQEYQDMTSQEQETEDSPLQEYLVAPVQEQEFQDSHLQESPELPLQESPESPLQELPEPHLQESQDTPLQECLAAPVQDYEPEGSPQQEHQDAIVQGTWDALLLENHDAFLRKHLDLSQQEQEPQGLHQRDQQDHQDAPVTLLQQEYYDAPLHEFQDSPVPVHHIAPRQEQEQEEKQVLQPTPLQEYHISLPKDQEHGAKKEDLDSPKQELHIAPEQERMEVQEQEEEHKDSLPITTIETPIESPASSAPTGAVAPASPSAMERPRSKRAMKRITKALKKERKNAKMEEQVKQQQLQRQQQQVLLQQQQQQQQQQQVQEQEQHQQTHHHHSLFNRKNHRQQSQLEKERLQYDPYQYKYTSHEGDHVHDQETLSVKSLDSEDDLDF